MQNSNIRLITVICPLPNPFRFLQIIFDKSMARCRQFQNSPRGLKQLKLHIFHFAEICYQKFSDVAQRVRQGLLFYAKIKVMIPELKFDEKGLIPAIIQDAESNEVLMMAYMDKTSLEKTLKTGFTHFWSRSRQKYWMKGETSGNVQEVKEILYDCDEDTLLVKVIQRGAGACHTGSRTCFFRSISKT
mgnify:CR=1 FL=1